MTDPAVSAPLPPQRMSWWNPLIDVLALFTVVGIVVGMLVQWFSAYFSIAPSPEEPDASEISTYWITAAIAAAICVIGIVAAIMRRNLAAIIGFIALSSLVVAAVVLFSVPQLDWAQVIYDLRNPDYPVNPNYCSRTDSENCPGG